MLPSPLTNVVVQQGNSEVLISWDFQSGATSYSVQRSTDLNTWSTLLPAPTVPQFLDDTVTLGTQYYYRVAGVNGSGTGAYSLPLGVVPTNPGQMSLGQARTLAQQEADLQNSEFVTKSEWNTYINQSYFELYDLLVQKFGDDYYVAPPVEFTTTGASLYDLPNGTNYSGAPALYKLLGVDLAIAAGSTGWLTLRKYEFIQRNNYVFPQLTTNFLGVGSLRYRLIGGQVGFIPYPAANQQIRLWYIPRMTTLLQDTDILDGISGWTEYVVVDAAIKAKMKQEDDITALMARKQMLLERIEAAAENRDAGEPEKISPVRSRYGSWGGGWDGGGDNGPFGGY